MILKTDITIIGAGLVGMTAACALAGIGLDVAIIDSVDLDEAQKKELDGRTCAIAAGSANFFKKIGVWDDMLPYAGQILDIRVTDNNSPIFLHYAHALVGEQPMGYIIENYHLRAALLKKCRALSSKSLEKGSIQILAPARYTDVKFEEDGCVVSIESSSTQETCRIESSLLIAADGKNSNIRKIAGIRTHEWQYKQSGLVCTIAHTNHHKFTAQERFLPEGPFAVLPMAGGYHSSLVWTEKTELAKLYLNMEEAEIIEQILLRTGEYLGEISLVGKLYSYPLSLCKSKRYIGQNLVLIGDAARAMHPLAGQGFNVGIRDVEELVRRFQVSGDRCQKGDSTENMISPITPNLSPETLLEYEQARLTDSISLLGITDILNRIFSNNIVPLRTARRLGMLAVNKATPLKKFFMKHAMGLNG